MLELILSIFSRIAFMVLNVNRLGKFPPPISKEKEEEYLKRVAEGDEAAKKLLVEHNLRLVAHVAKKYYGGPDSPDDLISIGTIGLIKAVSTFKAVKGIRLATYASRCIDNEILMYFRGQKKSAQDISISDPIDSDSDGGNLTLSDILADDSNVEDDVDLKLEVKKLEGVLTLALDEREQKIIAMRYGLSGGEELPQREVAKRLHISRSYVSRIEKKALEKLREAMSR